MNNTSNDSGSRLLNCFWTS